MWGNMNKINKNKNKVYRCEEEIHSLVKQFLNYFPFSDYDYNSTFALATVA